MTVTWRLGLVVLASVLAACSGSEVTLVATTVAPEPTTTTTARTTTTRRPTTSTTATTLPPTTTTAVLAGAAGVGRPWGDTVAGVLTFHGNPSRTWYGTGPVPRAPSILWRYPGRAMCGASREYGETKQWCGTGWVGHPAVFERGGRTWVVFGAYDYKIHFVDAATGQPLLAPFPTGDIAKGTVTVDPDGFPLVYAGSRDNRLRILAFDRQGQAVELWALDAHDRRLQPHLWNDDWDGSPLIVNGHLVTGGENGRFHVVKLNRSYGPDGLVQVAPELVFHAPTWDDELLANLPDNRVSVEGSVALSGDTAYFSNSGGLLQGWDLASLRTGQGTPARTFRFWTGDDTDASVVADAEGFLYVGQEWDRHNAQGRAVGQLLKIDPRRPEAPVVWSIAQATGERSGTWSTPALYRDIVIWPTYPGTVYGIDRATGQVRWEVELPYAIMSSPLVVDGVWIQGDANGVLHAFELGDGRAAPVERWTVQLPANVESTPTMWKGRLYVGTRDGFFYAVGDA